MLLHQTQGMRSLATSCAHAAPHSCASYTLPLQWCQSPLRRPAHQHPGPMPPRPLIGQPMHPSQRTGQRQLCCVIPLSLHPRLLQLRRLRRSLLSQAMAQSTSSAPLSSSTAQPTTSAVPTPPSSSTAQPTTTAVPVPSNHCCSPYHNSSSNHHRRCDNQLSAHDHGDDHCSSRCPTSIL